MTTQTLKTNTLLRGWPSITYIKHILLVLIRYQKEYKRQYNPLTIVALTVIWASWSVDHSFSWSIDQWSVSMAPTLIRHFCIAKYWIFHRAGNTNGCGNFWFNCKLNDDPIWLIASPAYLIVILKVRVNV